MGGDAKSSLLSANETRLGLDPASEGDVPSLSVEAVMVGCGTLGQMLWLARSNRSDIKWRLDA